MYRYHYHYPSWTTRNTIQPLTTIHKSMNHHLLSWAIIDHHELSLTAINHHKSSFRPTYPRWSTRRSQVLRRTLLEASCGGWWDDGWSAGTASMAEESPGSMEKPGVLEAEFLWVMGCLMAMGSWSWTCLTLNKSGIYFRWWMMNNG